MEDNGYQPTCDANIRTREDVTDKEDNTQKIEEVSDFKFDCSWK